MTILDQLADGCAETCQTYYRDKSRMQAAIKAALIWHGEACAKVCDEQAKEPECPERAAYCAEAIRDINA